MRDGSQIARVLALLAAILASSCDLVGGDRPIVPWPAPFIGDAPKPPSPAPTIADALTLRPEQVILPDAEFPLPGYSVDKDEQVGANGWTRNWRGGDAFSWVRVSVTVLGPSASSRGSIAATKCDDWTFTPPALSAAEIAAPAVGDGAKACGYDFKDLPVGSLQYRTGTRNVLVTVGVYRRSASQAAAAAFVASLADYQLWIIDRVAPGSGVALRPTPKVQVPSAAVAPPSLPVPTAPRPTPLSTPTAVPPSPAVVRNVPCGARTTTTVATSNGAVAMTASYVCYDATGGTVREITASMKANPARPKDTPDLVGQEFSAALTATTSRLTWSGSNAAGICSATSVAATLEVTFTYPRWLPPSNPAPEVVQRWNAYIGDLQLHEGGHQQIGIDAADDAVGRVKALRIANCTQATFDAVATQAWQAAMQAGREADLSYDAVTHHGLTQGLGDFR